MTGTVRVRNRRWVLIINYKDQFGVYKKKHIQTDLPERGNKKEAEKLLGEAIEDFQRELAANKIITLDKSKIRFIQYLKDFVKQRYDDKAITLIVLKRKLFNIEMMERWFGEKLLVRDVNLGLINNFYKYCREERNNKNATLKHYESIINPALRKAYKKDKLLKDDFIDELPRFRPDKYKLKPYRVHEADKLFEVIEGHKLELIIYLAAYYAIRRSENIGLKKQAFDFDLDTISVQHKVVQDGTALYASDELKTESSRRTLPLLKFIKEKIQNRLAEIEENRKLYGRAYNHDYLDYLDVDDMGNLIKPDYVTTTFGKILKKHGLRKIRFQDLRHSCATLLKRAGVPMKDIQAWLGHSNYGTTANFYLHPDEEDLMDAAKVIDAAYTKKPKAEIIEIEEVLSLEDEIAILRAQLATKEQQLRKKPDMEM